MRNPLLTVAGDGLVLCVESCAEPDSVPCVEFYSGMLVAEFPADWRGTFEAMKTRMEPLDELLRAVVPAPDGVLVVISGLDYDAMRLTERSQISLITNDLCCAAKVPSEEGITAQRDAP